MSGWTVLRRRTPLGWLQLRHDRSRFLVALAGIAFADLLIFAQLGFQAALYDSNTRFNRALKGDLVLLSPQARNLQNLSTVPRRRLYQALDVPEVAEGTALYIRSLRWRNPQTLQTATVQLVGFDPAAAVFRLPEVEARRHRLTVANTVLFDRHARGAYDTVIARVDRGEQVTTELDRQTLSIDGLFTLGASFGADATVLSSAETFHRLVPGQGPGSVSLCLLTLRPGADPELAARRLRRHLPEDVRVLTAAEYVRFEESYWRSASPIGVIFGVGTAMALVVGVVIVYLVLSTDVASHLGEYATFRAMGFRQRALVLVVFEQALILACIGFVPGLILPMGLYALVARATALPIAMTASRAALVFLLTLAMCAASGAIATRRLQDADPAELF